MLKRCFVFCLVLVSMSGLAAVPKGWVLAGSDRESYAASVEPGPNGKPVARYAAKKATQGFGTMMQSVKADKFAGKRVRFSALIKHKDVSEWAGLWMRIDAKHHEVPLGFDNMQNRPIKGTGDWRRYEVVLDVPADALAIFFGVLLEGQGEVWVDEVQLTAVGPEVAVTSMDAEAPVLEFK